MTSLQTLLEEKDIQKAVIINDAFDDVPQPDEIDEGDWSTFFDDLTEEDHKQFSDLYPKYEEITNVSELRGSSEFISVLWKNRKKLSTRAITALFQDYETDNENEKARLGNFVQILENAGLTCTTLGRDFNDEARKADLIIVDLFLGLKRSNDDFELGIRQVGELVTDRANNPPLIILTSNSSRLNEKRDDFRDRAGLLSSTFRVESKSDLGKEGRLESILFRLADHYEDAKRVAGFLYAWDKGLECTRKAFLEKLRRLDLSDLAQIRTLLLDSEGERLGDYLLDVADRVLQHEIESDQETIKAARELNNIAPSKYPAPHLMGTSDLHDLVYRMMFMHKDRLALSEKNGKPNLRFGDLLWWKKKGEEVYGDDVCLVVTPACDLVRNETEPVMLLSGKLKELRLEDWSYRGDQVRTSIIILPDRRSKWIKWNLRDVRTLRQDQLIELVREESLTRIARLREVYSLAIQQKLLAHMGRIGQLAEPPASFPVTVSLFYADTSRKARRLVPDDIESACYVGRGEKSRQVFRLVLAEQICDQIDQALRRLSEEEVDQKALGSLEAVKGDQGFIKKFERGVEIPPSKTGKKFIKGENNKTYAVTVRDEELKDGESIRDGEIRKSAVIVKVISVSNESDYQTAV